MKPRVRVRRIYEDVREQDGHRVLVDRVWPRGMSKERAALHEWRKDVAPTTDLRKWYGHDPDRFAEFRRRYLDELGDDEHRAAVRALREEARAHSVTLLTATKDPDLSAARVLADYLRQS